MKRKQTYLSNKEKWEVAKWAIENKCVVQDIHAYKDQGPAFIPFTLWRVRKNQASKEAGEALGSNFTDYHMTSAINFYNEICELTGSHPNVPAIQDTVEMDMLKVANKRLENDVKEITAKFSTLKANYDVLMEAYGKSFQAFRQIASYIPAECFGTKKLPDPKIVKSA